ncbi:MAG: ABC transporter permease [Acetobacteraceae bacterium]
MRAPVSNSVDEARSAGRIHDGSTGLRLRGAVNHFAPVAVLVALLTALGLFRPSFLSLYSLSVLAGESSVILLLAIGQTIVILLGGIDLSMAALASLVSVLLALALPASGAVGLALVLMLATAIGAVQGFVHARAQIPSFVVTLAGLGLWSGAALAIAHTTIPISAGYELVGWLEGQGPRGSRRKRESAHEHGQSPVPPRWRSRA